MSNEVDPSFWAGKRVLVTGHTGFKGAWLSSWLLAMGAEVTGLSDRVPTQPSMFELCALQQDVHDLRGDVRNGSDVAEAVSACRPDVVLHLAAQSLVRASYGDPTGTYATNVMGTVNVLEAVRLHGEVSVTLVVTSDKCYENREWRWGYRENEPMGGHDPYSSSKACAELVTGAYRASFFAGGTSGRVASARAGNVIGGGDWSVDRLLPDLIRGALEGTVVRIRRPASVRPWQHVLDCLSGYLVLVQGLWEDPSLQGGWNFGPDPGDQRTVGEIVQLLTELWPAPIQVELDHGEQPHEAGLLTLDCSQARQRLGWQPRWNADQALQRVVEWYGVHRDGGDMREVTMAQIQARATTVGAGS